VNDPDYRPYTTPELVAEAHDAGMAVIPWTINDRATMASLMDAGVDGLITDYPRPAAHADGRARPEAAPPRTRTARLRLRHGARRSPRWRRLTTLHEAHCGPVRQSGGPSAPPPGAAAGGLLGGRKCQRAAHDTTWLRQIRGESAWVTRGNIPRVLGVAESTCLQVLLMSEEGLEPPTRGL
jgi:hypothetical protein